MIIIEETSIKGRYNLVDTDKLGEDRYLYQLSVVGVCQLGRSIINLIGKE